MNILINILRLAAGFLMLSKGADLFVDGSSGIASKFGISQLVIGLTIVAMGTSSPEAAVSIAAAINGNADITIGNIVGSNILNIFIILGISALITTLAVANTTMKYETPFMIAITLLLLLLGLDGEIGTIDGIILLAAFAAYMVYLFRIAKNSTDESADDSSQKELSVAKAIIFTLIGLALIVFGSNITVDAASALATAFGLSERFIGLTIVAPRAFHLGFRRKKRKCGYCHRKHRRKQYLQYPVCSRRFSTYRSRTLCKELYL